MYTNYPKIMRRTRQLRNELDRNYKEAIDYRNNPKFEIHKGSPYFEQLMDENDKKAEAQRVQIIQKAINDLSAMFADSRKNANNRISKSPTAETAATLDVLSKMEHLTPADLRACAQRDDFRNCPLAMKRLSEIGLKHNVKIECPDSESILRAIDTLESDISNFIRGYSAAGTQSATALQLEPYFRSEEAYVNTPYKSAEKVDAELWNAFIGIGTPGLMDEDGGDCGSVKVQHYFKDLDGLLAYIDKETEGLEGKAKTDKVNEILDDCPNNYGTKYRYYLAKGMKMPLCETDEFINEDIAE